MILILLILVILSILIFNEKTWYKIMIGFIKKMFVVLLSSIVNALNHTKFGFLNNQNCENQPTLINLHPNKYSQEFH